MLVHKLLPLFALGLNLVLLGGALAPDRKSHRNLVFAYLATGLAIWNLGVFGLRAAEGAGTALAWERFLHLGVITIPALFYHYVLVFLDVPRRRPSLVLGYALCALFLAASPTPAFVGGVQETTWGFMPVAGPLYGAFFLYFQSYLILGLVSLIRAYRAMTSSFRRNRTLLVIGGVLVSLLGGAVDFVRFILNWEWLYPVGIPSNAIFALALGVAIVRYRMMDIGLLVRRLVLYLLTSLALAPILIIGLYGLDQLFVGIPLATPGTNNEFGALLRDALILLLIFTVALPLLRKLEQGLERLMFRRRHGVRDALVALSKEMSSLLDIGQLGRRLTEGLVTRVPVMHASLHLWDPTTDRFAPFFRAASDTADAAGAELCVDPALALRLRLTGRTLVVEEAGFQAADARMRAVLAALESDRVALLVPLFLEGDLAAILALGEKLSQEIFDQAEIELLEMLMGQAAIALKNSRLYDDLRRQMGELQRTQAQLVQSAKLAAIGELSASVAHEINNPLTVILGNSGLLLRELAAESPAAGRVATIVSEANRAGKITRDLLDFARRREPNREPLHVHEVVERALGLLESKLARGRVEVHRVFDPALPTILGDRDQLTQVFVNLVTNALDAMPDGGALTIHTEVRAGDGGAAVTVSVEDTGVGMDGEQLARIFEPFYTTKAEGRGTGLGLSVSQGIVRKHGGAIEAESKPGSGTVMRVTLPVLPRAGATTARV